MFDELRDVADANCVRDDDLPCRMLLLAHQYPEHGGLAGAVCPDRAELLSLGDPERDALQHGFRAIVAGYVLKGCCQHGECLLFACRPVSRKSEPRLGKRKTEAVRGSRVRFAGGPPAGHRERDRLRRSFTRPSQSATTRLNPTALMLVPCPYFTGCSGVGLPVRYRQSIR